MQKFKGKFNFFYLPMDVKQNANNGYAFVNMTNVTSVIRIYNEFNGKKWPDYNSQKICEIKYAKIQGYQNNYDKLEKDIKDLEHDARPWIFKTIDSTE